MTTWRPSPAPGDGEPRRVGETLGGMAKRLGVPEPGALSALFTRWPALVGEAVAEHARPVSLVKGVLVVGVDDPAWAAQLRYLTADLAARLSAELGEGVVERVEVRVRVPGGGRGDHRWARGGGGKSGS